MLIFLGKILLSVTYARNSFQVKVCPEGSGVFEGSSLTPQIPDFK